MLLAVTDDPVIWAFGAAATWRGRSIIEVSPRVFVDVAEDGRPVGLEILGLSQAPQTA